MHIPGIQQSEIHKPSILAWIFLCSRRKNSYIELIILTFSCEEAGGRAVLTCILQGWQDPGVMFSKATEIAAKLYLISELQLKCSYYGLRILCDCNHSKIKIM